MKKNLLLYVVLALLLIISLLLLGCQSETPVKEPVQPEQSVQTTVQTIELGVNSMQGATHFVLTEQLPRYFKMVEKAAGGKYNLDITYYPVGTLVDADKSYDGVVQGIVDMTQACFSYTPGRFPVMWTLYKPGIAPPASCDAAAATIWEYYQTLKPKELEDVKVVLLWAVGPGWVHTKNPITKVSELQGLKIRSTGAFIDAVKMVGGEPIGMPMGDVYLAAQKGSIDAAITPPEALETWKFCEIWKYSTFLPTFYSHFQYLVMNLDKWNSLPKDLQDAFDSVAEEAVKEAGQIWTYFNQQGIDYAESQTGGHEFIYFSPEEEAKLLEAIKPVRDNYIDELNAQGLPGEEIVNLANEIMSKNNEKTYEEWKP